MSREFTDDELVQFCTDDCIEEEDGTDHSDQCQSSWDIFVLEDSVRAYRADNERLRAALERACAENERLRERLTCVVKWCDDEEMRRSVLAKPPYRGLTALEEIIRTEASAALADAAAFLARVDKGAR